MTRYAREQLVWWNMERGFATGWQIRKDIAGTHRSHRAECSQFDLLSLYFLSDWMTQQVRPFLSGTVLGTMPHPNYEPSGRRTIKV